MTRTRSEKQCPRCGLLRFTLIMALLVALTGQFGTSHAFAKLNGDPCGGEPPAIVANPLAVAQIESLPAARAIFDLHRITLLPSAASAPFANGGPMVLIVDSGSVTLEIDGEATLSRFLVTEWGLWKEPAQVSGNVTIRYRDHISVPKGISVKIANENVVLAILLLTRVVPASVEISDGLPSAIGTEISLKLLARGLVDSLPASPAVLAMVRMIYAAGATDGAISTSGGPLLIAVEIGAIGYLVTEGEGLAVFSASKTADVVEPDKEVSLKSGDYAVEQQGVSSRWRNLSSERTWILLVTVVPMLGVESAFVCLSEDNANQPNQHK